MIVGTKTIPRDSLILASKSVKELIEFSDSLVPRVIRHNINIINNQRYLTAIEVRRIKSIDYDRRKYLCEKLLEGVSVRGTINTIIDFSDIMSESNVSMILRYMFKDVIH